MLVAAGRRAQVREWNAVPATSLLEWHQHHHLRSCDGRSWQLVLVRRRRCVPGGLFASMHDAQPPTHPLPWRGDFAHGTHITHMCWLNLNACRKLAKGCCAQDAAQIEYLCIQRFQLYLITRLTLHVVPTLPEPFQASGLGGVGANGALPTAGW